ncbi:hypothetical protein [Sphingomonas sp. MMS24-J13]|uniref:hypothetical protein n=1 Tax=Sphingomonas sp. MMS24-J13 TaxID=3238686 RepID=UPI0038517ED6
MFRAILKPAAILLPLALLAGCAASPEQRVRAALIDAGVQDDVAHCMARRMVEKLSTEQLLELKRLASLAKQEDPDGKMTPRRLLRKVEALGDPEVIGVTSRAALRCYIMG